MKRSSQAHKISNQMKTFLRQNPALREAFRVFDISYDQYQKALFEGSCSFYTDTSTSPAKSSFSTALKNK